ncbi:16S rRNA (cytidine(1402)-2'-O)-methyltransferase [Aquirufa nivalisilvae]|jgi:16S rRNA (cytidine1402-2'-O)-methyltransferase|uniref:16S rRNA (Cytidine(1402)-2'-O)-methyltransferase n=1 Tax=Aquirufa nivalisilvae TaxID=2516557 RepID=A0A2S2DW08_9BACT|nr:SAM-dependent methyltransferase [Aquirufa nivalisilvae]AWL09565.1 16S rRNA (cytidine(1402)-2'-O)-methyltransferase [Aquirufa nivalisilvae]
MKIYLIPCPIAENTATQVLAPEVSQAILTCQHFLVENIRTARRFISELKLGIKIDDLVFEVLDKDSSASTIEKFIQTQVKANHSIGIISEAGCPGIADPGALAVSIAHQLQIEVVSLVGPSSILLALMASGFSGQSFCFHGYLPIDKNARMKKIEQLQKEVDKSGQTQLFIETPYRNNALLEDLLQICPKYQLICIGCDIQAPTGFIQTKTAETWAKLPPDLHKKPCLFLLGQHQFTGNK